MKLSSTKSFAEATAVAEGRIDQVIGSKLESFFELAEYDWMPKRPQSTAGEPSTYVFEMITFLTAYVDSVLIGLNEAIKTRAYQAALARINKWLMASIVSCPSCPVLTCQETLCGKEVVRFNEGALAKVLSDVKFIETEVKRMEKPGLDHVFDEVKLVSCS